MSTHSPVKIIRLTREWIEIAESDFRVACDLLSRPKLQGELQIAFLSQQATEKYIKAWLCLHEVKTPYTHNIGFLLDLCLENHGTWAAGLDAADNLSPFGSKMRYPDEYERVTQEKAHSMVRIANEVRETLRRVLAHDLENQFGRSTDPEIQNEYKQFDLFE